VQPGCVGQHAYWSMMTEAVTHACSFNWLVVSRQAPISGGLSGVWGWASGRQGSNHHIHRVPKNAPLSIPL